MIEFSIEIDDYYYELENGADKSDWAAWGSESED